MISFNGRARNIAHPEKISTASSSSASSFTPALACSTNVCVSPFWKSAISHLDSSWPLSVKEESPKKIPWQHTIIRCDGVVMMLLEATFWVGRWRVRLQQVRLEIQGLNGYRRVTDVCLASGNHESWRSWKVSISP